MPILASRLARLIQAADTYIHRDQVTTTEIRRTVSHHRHGRMTAEAAIEAIELILTSAPPIDAALATITEERTRYNLSTRKNTIERERLRSKRAGEQFVNPFARYQRHHEGAPPTPRLPAHESVVERTDIDFDVETNTPGESPELLEFEQRELAAMSPDDRRNYLAYLKSKEQAKESK